MKKLILTMVAGALLAAFATVAQASGVHAGYTHLSAIDPAGSAVIAIKVPAAPIVTASVERVYFDSEGRWSANETFTVPFGGTINTGAAHGAVTPLYCFDSGSLFCAAAY